MNPSSPVSDGWSKTIWNRVDKYASPVTKNPYVSKVVDFCRKHVELPRLMIVAFFCNVALTNIRFWYPYGVPGVPYSAFLMLPAAIFCGINRDIPLGGGFRIRAFVFGLVLLLLSMKDAYSILSHQFSEWWYQGKELYINELMVKKASTIGAVLMLLLQDPYFKQRVDNTSKALQGFITDDKIPDISKKKSLLLLLVRLLISSFFLFVGYGEVTRQLQSSGVVNHGGHSHQRPPGDGHNQMWLKVLDCLCSLPFVVGFKTKMFSFILAMTLVAEAVFYWEFWDTPLGLWYSIHARDHFCTNIGVAGGLLLLQSYGPGKFSVDELLVKKKQ